MSSTASRSGPACLIEGFRLLARPGLRRFVILPVLGNLIIFALATLLLWFGLDTALDRWLPENAGWVRWILFPLLAFALLAGGLFAFAVLANILLGPFLGLLATQVIRLRGGEPPAESGKGFWADLRRDLALELRRLGYVLVCLLGVLVLSWIPLLQIAAAPLGVLVGAWLLAVEYAGHSLGLHRLGLAEQLAFLRQHRWAVLGFGLTSMAALLVPLLNLVVVPASVAGMTVLVQERYRNGGAASAA